MNVLRMPPQHLVKLAEIAASSKSQIGQDLFVLSALGFKRRGYFVEFGATNGIDLSNTYLLETQFGWQGILAEPAICWHADLRRNRRCQIDTDCVWKDSSSTLIFNETADAELSTVEEFASSDSHRRNREDHRRYEVRTVSLSDLLERYDAPHEIDYLSIDTEGSEYEILSNFDFLRFRFNVITCEHNYHENRERIYRLLTNHGYRRRNTELSRWDDWYVHEAVLKSAP
jgi:FkbM family methyltransferase